MDLKALAIYESKILLNVFELFEEAEILYQHGHYARAYALAHLSFEENAKATLLTYLAMDIIAGREITPETIQDIFTSQLFINHKYKLRIAFLKLPGYDYQQTVKLTKDLNEIKNKSLYTDILEGEMFKPSDFFEEGQASMMLDIAKNSLARRIEDFGSTDIQTGIRITEESIENYYYEMKVEFEKRQENETATGNVGYVDYLETLIKNEGLYNQLKITMARNGQTED